MNEDENILNKCHVDFFQVAIGNFRELVYKIEGFITRTSVFFWKFE